jgi:protein phosphatase
LIGRFSQNSYHRRSDTIIQALGGSSLPMAIEPHINLDAPLGPGETVLLHSDGLSGMVNDDGIARVLAATDDPVRAVHDLAAKVFDTPDGSKTVPSLCS